MSNGMTFKAETSYSCRIDIDDYTQEDAELTGKDIEDCSVPDGDHFRTHFQFADLSDPDKDFTGIRKPDAEHPANADLWILEDEGDHHEG